MTEYERGFIDGMKSKVSAELTPTLINVSKTMLEMLKPVLSTALENALNDNNAITDTDVQPVVHCKDCKYRKERHYEASGENPYIKYECKFTKYSMSDEGFCSFGAKLDGDTNG